MLDPMATNDDAVIDEILRSCRVIAVVGVSTDPSKPSAYVAAYLQAAGYTVVPVHPKATTLLGVPAYPSLEAIPGPVDMVNVFRPAEETPAWAKAAGRIGAKALWLQQGIVSEAAARIARAAGLAVVMDRCLMVEHRLRQAAQAQQ
jgi:uncharacterized protein